MNLLQPPPQIPQQAYPPKIQQKPSQAEQNSIVSRKSNPRTLYFKKQYKLLIHKIHVFNNLGLVALSQQIGRKSQAQCQAVYNYEKVVDVVVMNAIKGKQDYQDQKLTLYLKQQSSFNSSIIGTIKFDLTQQKMLKIQNKKSFQKQFEAGDGYIDYKFISYKSQHINEKTVEQERDNRQVVWLGLNFTKDHEYEMLMKAKDDIINKLESKVSQLIGDNKRVKKSLSKEKDKLQKELKSLKLRQKSNPKRKQQSPQSYYLNAVAFHRQPQHFNTIFQQENSQQSLVLAQRKNQFNINVKIQTTKARQKQIQTLKQINKENQQLKRVVDGLKQENGSLSVENKLLEEQLKEAKRKYQNIIESKYKQLKGTQNIKQLTLKESAMLMVGEKPRKLKVSGIFTPVPSQNMLAVQNDPSRQSIEPELSPFSLIPPSGSNNLAPPPSPKPRFNITEFIQDNNLNVMTSNLLQKLQHENEMLESRLAIKQDQNAKLMKELSNCTVNLRKKTQQLAQLKTKMDDFKTKSRGFLMDGSGMFDSELGGKESVKLSERGLPPGVPQKFQKIMQDMKQSIISYEGKMQEQQVQLMKSRLVEQTLQKEKALYENKYMNILQSLQQNKEKYVDAINKTAQFQDMKVNNEQLRNLVQQIMKKYEEQCKIRADFQEKNDKYKKKLKDLVDQWSRLKDIQTQCDSLRKRIMVADKNLAKFDTTYGQMRKFVLKIESSFYNVTKKSKSKSKNNEDNEQQLQQLLQQAINRLNQLQQQYYDNIRQYFELQKRQIDTMTEKKVKLQMDKIDDNPQLSQNQKLVKKQAMEQALDSERRSKRKKVDTKIKQLLQEKAKSEESYEKMGVSLYDRIKNMEKKLRAFEEKLLEMPSGKIVVGQGKKSVIKIESKQLKELKEKFENLEQENQSLKQKMSESMIAARKSQVNEAKSGKSSSDQYNLKYSDNATLQMQKSQLGQSIKVNLANNESIIRQQRKSMLQEMNRNREVFTKSFEELKKQNGELMRKKSQLQIQLQNYRFRQQKMVMKHQQKQRQLQRIHKQSSDQLTNTKQRLQAKIQKLQKDNTLLSKDNKQYQQSLSALIIELRRVSIALEQRDKQWIQLSDDNGLMKERIFSYEEAERRMMAEIQEMKDQAVRNQDNFNQLFEERCEQFMKIQRLKNGEIQKLKNLIQTHQHRIQEEVAEQLRLKDQLEKFMTEIKRLQETNLGLQESQAVMSQKLENLRKNSTEEVIRLQEENEALRSELMKLAETTSELQEQLEKSLLKIQSLERQVQTLEPIYNEMCQMELKNQAEKDKYQDLMAGQNQKFLQLRQRYEKILQQVKQVQQQNASLRLRDLQFQQLRQTLNDKIFDKERLVLRIEKEKNAMELEQKQLRNELDEAKDKQNHYVIENHELAIKLEELQQQVYNQKSAPRSKFANHHDTSSFIEDNQNHSKLFKGSRMLGESSNKNDIKSSTLRRSGSRVLQRSRSRIQMGKGLLVSNNSIGVSRTFNRSNTYTPKLQRKDSNVSNISISQNTHLRARRDDPSELNSPYGNLVNKLDQIEQNIDEMKGTIFMSGNKIPQTSPTKKSIRFAQSNKIIPEQLIKSKTLQQDLNIQQMQQSLVDIKTTIALQNLPHDRSQSSFHSEDESQYQLLMALEKKQIIERVHQLKEELASVTDQLEGMKQQVNNYQQLIRRSRSGQGQDQMDYDDDNIKIEIHESAPYNMSREKHQSTIRDMHNMTGRKSSSGSRSEQFIMSKNNDFGNGHIGNSNVGNSRNIIGSTIEGQPQPRMSRMQTIERDRDNLNEEVSKLKAQIAEKELFIQQKSMRISQLQQCLSHQKQNTSRLLAQVSNLIKDTQSIQQSLRQKNHQIQHLTQLLSERKQYFDNRLEELLKQNLEKDESLVKIAEHCDQLERSKQEYLKQRQEVEQQWKVVNSKYTKVKQRMKQSEQSFKQYEEQAELEILKLKEHADDLRKEIGQKNRELVELAERYVKLQGEYEGVQMRLLEKGSRDLSQKEKAQRLSQKYAQLSTKLSNSQQARHNLTVQNNRLQQQLLAQQSLILDLKKKSSLLAKKHTINLTTTQQRCEQLSSKNTELQQTITQLKHQLSLQNQDMLSLTNQNHQLNVELNRVERQLKEIMVSYEREFSEVDGKRGEEEMKNNAKVITEKDKELEVARREKRELEGQLYKMGNQMYEAKQDYERYRTKMQLKVKELSEKYQFKNNECEILKAKIQRQTDSTLQSITKHSTNQTKLQQKLTQLNTLIKQKDTKLHQSTKSHQLKQLQLSKNLQDTKQKAKLLQNRITQLEQQLEDTKFNYKQAKAALGINTNYTMRSHQSAVQSLNTELGHYEFRVQQLEKQNYQLRRMIDQYQRQLRQLSAVVKSMELKYQQKLDQMQEQVEFYKAKRIDQLNMLLNQTDD